MPEQTTIVIIGAGVIGLSIALTIQAHLKSTPSAPRILLIAQEWPASIPGAPLRHSTSYASMWAGAHVRPIPASTPQLQLEASWLKQTVRELDSLATLAAWSGITRTTGIEFLESPSGEYLQQDADSFLRETGLSGYKRLEPSELPPDVDFAFEYDTFCINPPVYCQVLLRRFLLGGGKTLKASLGCEWDAFSAADATRVLFAVNASGSGFGDEACFSTRGQTVVTDLNIDKTITRQHRDGTWSFLIPRFFDGGSIVGGTKEPHDWRAEPSVSTRNTLLEKGLQLVRFACHSGEEPEPGNVKVISDVVGRRPTRNGGMRVEVERRTVSVDKGHEERVVIHAYGAGGRGYEVSWGVADEVMRLAMPLLDA